MNRKFFSLPLNHIEFEQEDNKDLLRLKMYAISDGENRNESEFLLSSFEPAIKTMYNRPILAYFNEKIQDTESHNVKLVVDNITGEAYYDYNYPEAEKPVGVIPESAEITVQPFMERNWIVIDGGLIWTSYNRNLTRMIKRQLKKKVSVEIEVLESYMDGKIEKITSFRFMGITILGKTPNGKTEIMEGIENAHMFIDEYLESDNFIKYSRAFNFAQQHNFKLDAIEDDVPAIVANMEADNEPKLPALKLSLTKKSASNSPWSNVDKTKLRNDLLDRPNTATLVEKCYLVAEEGWQDSPSEALKYPVCQIKDDTLVYNINGVQAANSRLEQNTNESYYKSAHAKLMRICKILGLKAEQTHINYQGGSTHMKEKFIALFSEGGKYKYLNSTEKSVTAFSIEDKKFVMIPFSVEEDAIVMQEDKLMEAEVFAKPLEDNEEFEAMGCHEFVSELYEEVEKMSVEVKEKDEKFAEVETAKTAEMEAKEAEFAEKIEKLEADKTFALEEVKKYKEIQFSSSLSQLAKEYKMNEEDVKSWSEKFSTFAVVEDFEKEVVFEQHKKNLSFSKDSTHINLGGVDKTKTAEKKRAVDRIKETLIK